MQPFLYLYVYYIVTNMTTNMKALLLIETLTFSKATSCKLETANIVLNELKQLKASGKMPFMVMHRAIKIQEKVIKSLS